ncbi:MAG: DUF3575 domain-containing protein [Bacteroidetes bacterium]|nr:MAG: DUF3575 domain-containing protein [Bacteroidota bacterium]REK04696.1 MAG: DUF3575 domain-containing protein [Bacteroidota bacterium]REK36171.1 MAG: DUF3575 domain-containing protein [Bacteroidota bacterium]REK51458.1 MAG: DUF3575 domain-containing protein [Bacteroidota bacterium]
MKKLLYLICVLLISSVSSYGQGESTVLKNNFKVNLTSLAAYNISMQYERSLTSHTALALGFSVLPLRGLPSFVIPEGDPDDLASLRFSGYSVTPEFRFYLSGKRSKGFYFAPYYRHSSYNCSYYELEYNIQDQVKGVILMSGDYKQSAAGLMIGSQWNLGKRMSFDWWILGAAKGSQVVTLRGNGDFSLAQQVDLSDQFSEFEIPYGELSYTVDQYSAEIVYKTGLPTIRGLGFCLGYRF